MCELHQLQRNAELKVLPGTSLVIQWLGILLPIQGTRVGSLVQEDSTRCRATRPVCHSYSEGQLPLSATRDSLHTATQTQHSQK